MCRACLTSIVEALGCDIHGSLAAVYRRIEELKAATTTTFDPDHNGECLHCDEPADAHLCPATSTGGQS